jgi:hypothetical protein
MRVTSTAVLVAGFAFWSVGAFAQEPKITGSSQNLTTSAAPMANVAAPQFATASGGVSSITSDQLGANTGRLSAAAVAPNPTALGTSSAASVATAPSASFATPTGAGSASLSIASVNVAAVEPSTVSSMAGVQTSSEANGNLHAFTSTATRPLGR